jgi:hypothetical protein
MAASDSLYLGTFPPTPKRGRLGFKPAAYEWPRSESSWHSLVDILVCV